MVMTGGLPEELIQTGGEAVVPVAAAAGQACRSARGSAEDTQR